MKRRDFVRYGLFVAGFGMIGRALFPGISAAQAPGAAAKPGDAAKASAAPKADVQQKFATIADKDVLKEGQPSTLPQFCNKPGPNGNKHCPDFAKKPGKCSTCQFFQNETTASKLKGKSNVYAKCQLLTDPAKAQYVADVDYCASWFEKQKKA